MLLNFIPTAYHITSAQTPEEKIVPEPIIVDSKLRAEVFFTGLEFPTSMAFLGPNDILVLEKNNGTVKRIVNGQMLEHPVLDVDVANEWTRGMLGIAVSKNSTTDATHVFLYYTESEGGKDGDDDCPNRRCIAGKEPLGNRLYRYELKDNKLVNPKLMLDLPAGPAPNHNGGVVVAGPDNNIYLVVGDLTVPKTVVSNNKTGLPADGTAGILRVTNDGKVVGDGILGNTYPLNLYYAYGLRNSFGMDFDPVSGNLWDTENGPAYGDEINLVKPGFNSGWMQVQGIWKPIDAVDKDKVTAGDIVLNPSGLLDFDRKGNYSNPAFTWKQTPSPTALKFFNSDKFGADYKNDMFVADTTGKIYRFELNENRTRLVLGGSLSDNVADDKVELQDMIFAKDFEAISDLEVGPDHNLYVISYPSGTIFKISPSVVT